MSIVVLADMHVGHLAAIWPDNYTTEKGNVIAPNPEQYALLRYWDNFWNKPEIKAAKYVVNLAESIEGYSPREHGPEGIMTQSLNEQIRAFKFLLEPHIKNKIYLSVEGSRYHGSRDNEIERIITEEIKAKRKHYFGYIGNWVHKSSGKRFMLIHKLSGATQYKVTGLDRFSLYLSAIKSKIKTDYDVVLSAHDHQFFMESTPSRTLIKAPGWKFWHPIKDAARYPFSQPTIGALLIEAGKEIVVRKYFYPLEHIYDLEVGL